MAELMILARDTQDVTVPGVLDGFPFLAEQYAEQEIADNPDGNRVLLRVHLGDAQDTTAAQEQFLNTSNLVLEYNVLDELDEQD